MNLITKHCPFHVQVHEHSAGRSINVAALIWLVNGLICSGGGLCRSAGLLIAYRALAVASCSFHWRS